MHTTPPTIPARRSPGFTMVELLVIVVILGFMASVVLIPTSADSGTADLDLAEVEVRDAFSTAQTIAYSLGVPCGVVFDTANERFAVVTQDGKAVQDPLTHGAYEIDFKHIEQPRGVAINTAAFGTTGTAGIMDAQGVPVTGGSVVLSKGSFTRTLTLDPATGKLVAS